MIRLNILPDNLQLAATSSSRTNSLSFFLDPVYDLTRSTPLRLAVGRDVIQLRSIRCNYIWRCSPDKVSRAFILFSVVDVS